MESSGNYGRLIGLVIGVVIAVPIIYFMKRSEWQKKQQAGEFSPKPKVMEILKTLFIRKK